MLNREVKAKWIKALRSGQYTQGRGALMRRSEDGQIRYCCLGVLCNVLDEVEKPTTITHLNGTTVFYFEGDHFSLSTEIKERIGLSTSDESALISLNDDDQLSFEQIANYIEKHL